MRALDKQKTINNDVMLDYERKKSLLLQQIQAEQQRGKVVKVGLKKATSNLFRHRQSSANTVAVSDFNRVLNIDTVNMRAEVEGLITYEDFVRETLKYDCLPAVVPELKSITVGGALAGIGIESSSFRYGLVHETIPEFEVLLPHGETVLCRTDNEHQDLFFGFPNSYGSLGYALRVVVKLIPVKKYVKLTHHHFVKPERYYRKLSEFCEANRANGPVDFIDSTVFQNTLFYVTTGEFVDEAPYTNNYKYMKIYYKSIKDRQNDYLTTEDYIWRWDTDWFWCSRVFGMQNPLLRFIFGKFLLKSTMYWKMMRLAHKSILIRPIVNFFSEQTESVIQDVAIPLENAEQFFQFFNEEVGITPFWNCPVMAYNTQYHYDFFPLKPNELYINFGFWDTVYTGKEDGYLNRKIEAKVVELGGLKSLYSNAYYTKDEFWKIFDKEKYDALKAKYDPSYLKPDLFTKCTERN